jgi:hypothetical protein
MAALKALPTSEAANPTFNVSGPDGRRITLRQVGAVVRLGSALSFVELAQADVAGILGELTEFSVTGRLSGD